MCFSAHSKTCSDKWTGTLQRSQQDKPLSRWDSHQWPSILESRRVPWRETGVLYALCITMLSKHISFNPLWYLLSCTEWQLNMRCVLQVFVFYTAKMTIVAVKLLFSKITSASYSMKIILQLNIAHTIILCYPNWRCLERWRACCLIDTYTHIHTTANLFKHDNLWYVCNEFIYIYIIRHYEQYAFIYLY